MHHDIIVTVVAFAAVLASLPLARLLGRRLGAWDTPDELGMHPAPVPRSGGIAILLGVVLSLETMKLLPGTGGSARQSAAVTIGTLAFFLVGLLDDLHEIRPYLKAIGLVLAALLFAMLSPYARMTGFERLDVMIAVLALVGGANALNFMDGLDGLAAGMAAIAALGFCALSRTAGLALEGSWALALAGACAAFWLANMPPARIFMGDCGSLVLGFSLSGLLLTVGAGHPVRLMAGAIILSPLILDTGLAIVRRLLLHRDVFTGDRRHLYDLVYLRTRSVWKTDISMYLLGLCFAGLGAAAPFLDPWAVASLAAAGWLAVSAWAVRLGMFSPVTNQRNGT